MRDSVPDLSKLGAYDKVPLIIIELVVMYGYAFRFLQDLSFRRGFVGESILSKIIVILSRLDTYYRR